MFLAACVTINIYFPAAEAQQAAEKIVEDILQATPTPPAPKSDDKGAQSSFPAHPRLGQRLLDFLLPTAHAAQPDFSVDSPQIRRLQASLKQRHGQLVAHLNSGALGFTQDGLLALRDSKAIALRDRNAVKQLMEEDNHDRSALYQAIAKANGHPEWEREVRNVFARAWIDKAQPGWWYTNSSGVWIQK